MSQKDSYKKAFINARLLDPFQNIDIIGGIMINNHNIIKFGTDVLENNIPQDYEIIDVNRACITPGFIDIRAQLREPGFEIHETIETGVQSAVAGGITTIVAMPNTNPVVDNITVIDFIHSRSHNIGLSKVFSCAAVSKKLQGLEMTEMFFLHNAGAIAFSDGIKTITSPRLLQKALLYCSIFNGLIIQHPQEAELSKGASMNSGAVATRLGLSGVSSLAEVIQIERDLRILEMTGGRGRLHFSNISTAESVSVIRRAKKRGLNITCDTAPFYFSLNENIVLNYQTIAKLDPPLRSETDRKAIIMGLIDGTIDIIASDHNPHHMTSKDLPFSQASAGAIGFETLLPIVLELYHKRYMSLIDVIKKITSMPAQLIGIDNYGLLKEGSIADLVIFDPDHLWKIDVNQFYSKSKNSPFHGHFVKGHILRTLIGGREVFKRKLK